MSLLLDALKRAEQAKQESGEAPAPEVLSIEVPQPEAPAASEPAAPLITRDRLPDISQSLEILTDDISPPPLLRTARETPRNNLNEAAATQAQARRLFDVKEKRTNPKTPFYIALGALGISALAGAGYVWYAMQPHSAPMTVRATPPAASGVAQTAPAIAPPAQPAYTPVEMIVPPLQSAPAVKTKSDIPPTPAASAKASVPRMLDAGPSLSKTTAPGLSLSEQAYTAFERGDMVAARGKYEAALAQDPRSRDAMLGLAALDAREGNYQGAEARYLKVLEADPRNPHAHAAMTALRGQNDPVASESRLKNLLAHQPDGAFLHFALGNLYAKQNRWSEAQQEYFKAFVAEPANADFAFNLAVSLDHLRQTKPAADYYRKALDLHAARPGGFNPLQAQTRLRELATP